ncbi:MAG: methyltransferase [Thermoleophilaceae bacterium]|nr:methyltransferase [Thermoleophilaceae bacterium]
MRLVTLPGVFTPISDSRLLADCLRAEVHPGARVADLCTGSGLLAVVAACQGAAATAVDVSRRAVITARLNARLNGVRVRALRGDLLAPLDGERFDVIVSNPPYVPATTGGRAWAGGRDGRALIDRICDEAPGRLRPGGALLLVHSSVNGEAETLGRLAARGLRAEIVARRRGPLGPLMRERVSVRDEELLVVRGRLP